MLTKASKLLTKGAFRQFSKSAKIAYTTSDDEHQEVAFLKRESQLLRILKRSPDDGFFPKIKATHEIEVKDVPELVKEKNE